MNTTIKQKLTLLSKKGMRELKNGIAQLEHDRRALIRGLHEISKSPNHDDRIEHIERLAQLEAVESELTDKRSLLGSSRIIPSRRARLKVAIGSVVDLIDQQGRLFTYTIVESVEANPSDGRISIASPLGQRLLGRTVKDMVEWSNGMRVHTFRLVNIT
jgi:transcription elongation factor GreA